MARRRGWKRGDWLVRDEESGFTEYASKVRRDYYGKLTRDPDPRHPQDFIKAKADPFINEPQAPPEYSYNTSAYNLGDYVGGTTVVSPYGPADHLFRVQTFSQGGGGSPAGIGEMVIGSSFIVA